MKSKDKNYVTMFISEPKYSLDNPLKTLPTLPIMVKI